ncbi:MAG: XRE family transcriptional regulator, partial [Alphaproteobacteria bacterium]|nr:XRE family transcriptional regulator [Alphaproteobacteria bacterium]
GCPVLDFAEPVRAHAEQLASLRQGQALPMAPRAEFAQYHVPPIRIYRMRRARGAPIFPQTPFGIFDVTEAIDAANMRAMPPPPPSTERQFYLRAWREHRGVSQNGLAREIGVTPSRINEVENGERYNETLVVKIAEALKIERWCLLMGPPALVEPIRMILRDLPAHRLDEVAAILRVMSESSKP